MMCVVMIFFITHCAISESEKSNRSIDDLYAQIELFSYALTTVQAAYVEEPTAKELIYGSLKGMLSSLDPHSQFLTPDDFKDLKTETEGRFGGLGIEISIRDNLLTIITPLEDTPAWRAGMKSMDRIVNIDGESTRNITLSEAVKKLRGKPGTEVNLTIFRESENKILDLTVTREVIRIQDVKDVMIIEDRIGYIRLTEFREDSHREFKKALTNLRNQGAESLILDLRNNPGGLLNIAINIAEEFLPRGKKIVSTKSRHPAQESISKSSNQNGDFLYWPMAVLINEGSASGSEILAGALQDNNRAIILGMKSFGKGSVQSVIPLPDGSGLKLTTSTYFTPSGHSIHGLGIEPDIIVERKIDQKESEEISKEEQKKIDKIFQTIEEIDEVDETARKQAEIKKRIQNDNQIQAAIKVLKGIKVFQRHQQI